MHDSRIDAPLQRHLRPRFTLKAIFIGITLIGVVLGYFATKAQRSRRAIDLVLATRGEVAFEYQRRPLGSFDTRRPSPAPAWLRETAAEELFRTARRVRFPSGPRGPSYPVLTDDDLAVVASLSDVDYLTIQSHPISDAGLQSLSRMTRLEGLVINNGKIEGPGIAFLLRLPHLTHLEFSRQPITDEGLNYIGQMQGLTFLMLGGSQFTDNGLASLASLTNLKTLGIVQAEIGDDGIAHLHSLTWLSELYLSDTRVTTSGAARFRKAVPNCKIHLNGRRI